MSAVCEASDGASLRDPLTFVLEEVAHAGAAGEDELGDVLDDFGFVLGRECGEPLGQALRAGFSNSSGHVRARNPPLCPAARAG